MFRWLLIVAILLAAVAGLVLGVLNADPVTFNLIAGELTLPLGALVVSALALGLLAGLILAWLLFIVPGRFRRSDRAGDKDKNKEKGTALAGRQHG